MDSPECHKNNLTFSFLDSWAAVWYYEGYIRESLLRYKFCHARHYAPVYGRMLAMRIQREYPDGFDVLTWVPISRLRRFSRGYDQVELLAEAVGQELGMQPVSTLKKVRNNRPQSGASVDRKPSNTVKSPGDRISVNRPGHRPGDRKPSSGPAMGPNKPGHRPSAGSAFKPDKHKPPVKVYPNHKHDRPRVHPVRRDFITYDRPSSFWNHHHHHYFGYRVRVLPARAKIFRHHGIAYYCYNDIWYRPYGSYYVICRPPFGTVLAANLIHDLAWTAVRFSYYNTVFSTYRQINENNSYIAEQNEIIAKNNAIIAAQNQTIAMNQAQAAASVTAANDLGLVQSYAAADGEYFYQDGVFYAKDKSGEYKVIVPPAGALVESLPDDYEMITIKGTEYYKVDDTVYKVVLSEGKPVFEVMGQLFS